MCHTHSLSYSCRSVDFLEPGALPGPSGAGEGEGEREVEEIKTEPLTEKQVNQVSTAVELFGMEVVRNVREQQQQQFQQLSILIPAMLYIKTVNLVHFLMLQSSVKCIILMVHIPIKAANLVHILMLHYSCYSNSNACSKGYSNSLFQLEKLYSKQYFVRERSLLNIQENVTTKEAEDLSAKDITTLIRAVCEVLMKGLNDQVHSVSATIPRKNIKSVEFTSMLLLWYK